MPGEFDRGDQEDRGEDRDEYEVGGGSEEQTADERIAWNSTAGEEHAGVVTFHRLSDDTTKVTLQLTWEPKGAIERIGSLLQIDDIQIDRDLRSFTTDIATTEALIPLAPEGAFLISESGIGSAADCARLEAAGAHGFLVGESLMRQEDVTAATRTILANPLTAPGGA